jgi:hypothetical protein
VRLWEYAAFALALSASLGLAVGPLIRTMLGGRACGAIYRDSREGTAALSGKLDSRTDADRTALRHELPRARLSKLNNVAGSYS